MALRYVWEGKIWAAVPATVVQDEPDLTAIYTPPGTGVMRAVDSNGNILRAAGVRRERVRGHGENDWDLESKSSFNQVLRLFSPGASHSVWLIWREPSWELICWYVNLEEPTTRTPVGFDTWDQELDIVIGPGFSRWRWKDEEHFEEAQALGFISPERAEELRAEGRRVIGLMNARKPPFNGGWERWRPHPSWGTPELPSGWHLA